MSPFIYMCIYTLVCQPDCVCAVKVLPATVIEAPAGGLYTFLCIKINIELLHGIITAAT